MLDPSVLLTIQVNLLLMRFSRAKKNCSIRYGMLEGKVIKTSDYGGGHKTLRIFLAYERSGQYRAHKKLKANDSSKKNVKITGTKKCGCPFELRARKLMANDDWMVDVACGMHNHAPAKHFEGHSFVGRLSEDEISLLVDMSKSMVRPKEILVTLKRKDALNVTTMKTIYNVRHRNNVIEKAGRSQMQQLFGELQKHNYIERHRCDNNMMTVTDLFWAHPVSLDLLYSFPKVLTIDCTYKTNRYRLPLLEIVGVTSTDMSFFVAFAYLQFERIDNYVWVLTTLRSLFDDIAIPEVIVTDRKLALMNVIDNCHDVPLVVRRVALVELMRALKMMGNYGMTFAAIGGVYIGIEKLLQNYRMKRDFINGAVGGFVGVACVLGYKVC
ncbi:unnamed protein product [Camellia sinensis]